jgi:hypothetical protein
MFEWDNGMVNESTDCLGACTIHIMARPILFLGLDAL